MKNKFLSITAFSILFLMVLGCSSLNPLSSEPEPTKPDGTTTTESGDSTSTDNPTDEIMPEDTGVKECNELTAYIAKISQSKDEGYVAKAAREFFLNRVRESLRESVEKNKNNPEELAKKCKELKTQLEGYKQKEDEQKENQ